MRKPSRACARIGWNRSATDAIDLRVLERGEDVRQPPWIGRGVAIQEDDELGRRSLGGRGGRSAEMAVVHALDHPDAGPCGHAVPGLPALSQASKEVGIVVYDEDDLAGKDGLRQD